MSDKPSDKPSSGQPDEPIANEARDHAHEERAEAPATPAARFVAFNPRRFLGQVVDNGQSVRFVQVATLAPHTSQWRPGPNARTGAVEVGTALATFSAHGRYENRTDGASHACIFLAHQAEGLQVLSQWPGQAVHQRLVRYRGGVGAQANDGDAFFVVTTGP